MAVNFLKLEESPYLLDLLIKMEDVFDSLDIYVFRNWIDAEVAEGPFVRRYWLSFTLRTPYRDMPDPKAAKRLLKAGLLVEYKRVGRTDEDEGEWLIEISIPRRLITELNAQQLNFYDDEVDVDDIIDANDQGMTEKAGYVQQ